MLPCLIGENITVIKNICNPCGEKNGPTHCSIGCMDRNFSSRIGEYYPVNGTTASTVISDCPLAWSIDSHKVDIEAVDYKTDYMKGIKIYACVIAAFNILAVLFIFFRSLNGITVCRQILSYPTGMTVIKIGYMLAFVFSFIQSMIDSITDAYYFGSLEVKGHLVHVNNNVINAMAAFLFFAMIKDYFCSGMTIDYHISVGKMKLDGTYASQLKTFKFTLSAILEDFVQVNMQYFFFEKYLMEQNTFVYLNAILMLAVSALFIKDLVNLYREERQKYDVDERVKTITLIIQGILAITYQTSRLVGTVHQMTRGGSLIKGACLKYDYETKRLSANPLNIRCLNPNDYVLMVTSALTCLGIFQIIFGECCCIALFRRQTAR